jgi:hypothetical protein
MEIKKNVEIKIVDMKDGKVTGFYIDNDFYVFDKTIKKEVVEVDVKKILDHSVKLKRAGAPNIVEKYILKNKLSIFNPEQFLKDNPKFVPIRHRVEKYIARLISEKKLAQDGDKLVVKDYIIKRVNQNGRIDNRVESFERE